MPRLIPSFPLPFLTAATSSNQSVCVCVLVWTTNRDNAYDSAGWDLTAESWSFQLCGELLICCNHQLAAAATVN